MECDVFDKLFVDESAWNKELVLEILEPYIKLTKEGSIIPLSEFHNLSNEKKLVLVVLSRKVLAAKNITAEAVSPTEVQNITGLSVGSVNPTLTALASKGILKNDAGKYSVPNYAIHKIREIFK